MRFAGLVYRAHNPRWSFDPTSGHGAARYGGRFNRVGVPALYTSCRMETAWLEAQQGFPFKAQPLTICAYDVDCVDIVNLSDAASCQAQGVDPVDLACPWEDIAFRGGEPPSWRVTRALAAEGHAGLIVPSFAPGAGPLDRNIVFWNWSDAPPQRVLVIDDENRLPRDDRSWNPPEPL